MSTSHGHSASLVTRKLVRTISSSQNYSSIDDGTCYMCSSSSSSSLCEQRERAMSSGYHQNCILTSLLVRTIYASLLPTTNTSKPQVDQCFHEPSSVKDFIAIVGVNPALGLERNDAITRRQAYGSNRVTPPVNCPSWICCLLPCLLKTKSMQAYNAVVPRDAMVRRQMQTKDGTSSKLLRIDAVNLVYGDIVELKEGDKVSADMRVISCSEDCIVDQSNLIFKVKTSNKKKGEDEELELLEEGSKTSRTYRRKQIKLETDDEDDSAHSKLGLLACRNALLMTTEIVSGTAIGVVLATGNQTVWGQLIANYEWP